jgi:rare lipoprotein A
VPVAAVPVGGWFVQVTALSSRPRAEEIAELLGARVEPVGTLWRVRLGPYPSETDASNALAQVRSRGYQESRLVRIEAADGATAEGFPRR